ncbi:glycerol kinase GlpK [bacterium]|nr:glycerol kinase GlpK [bacterium]
MTDFILALDQGTTSSRAMAIDLKGTILGLGQEAFPQVFPQAGWVEHDPEAIWSSTVRSARAALAAAAGGRAVAIGVTNQRETVVVWDRATGELIHNAIVWQDRRTTGIVQALQRQGEEGRISDQTGLVLDPYFSATKIAWILDHVDGARARAERGELACGTIDSFLIHRLTEGRVHATDATNASRTSLFDISAGRWDEGLCALFRVPMSMLPEVRSSDGFFGETSLFGSALAITGVAGDQQAALVGQACLAAGEAKCTYGTGAFLVLNTGAGRVRSRQRMLSTIAYRVGDKTTYAIEGSILSAGTTIQWLRDQLGVIRDGAHAGELAASVEDSGGVHLVPAFTGLGAPYWDPDARGAILGLTRGTSIAHIARAALEATVFQTAEVVEAMRIDGAELRSLKVDGGMARNDWMLGFLADIVRAPVLRPTNTETTVLGAAMLAGVGAGVFASLDEAAGAWTLDRRFEPAAQDRSAGLMADWRRSVQRVRSS